MKQPRHRRSKIQNKFRFAGAATLLVLIAIARAQVPATETELEADVTAPQGREIHFTVVGGAEHQFQTDLDMGGKFSVSRFGTRLGAQTDLNPDLHLSMGLGYNLDLYDFSDGALNLPGGADPWDDIHTITANAVFSLDLNNTWTVFAGPIFQSAREAGADFGDSILGGGTLGATYRVSDEFTVGGGVVIVSQIEEDVKVFPILVLDWEVADDFFLRSQTGANSVGRTGLELVYRSSDTWEFALGAARDFSRFRLDDEGAVPDGVGEEKSIPVWFRASCDLSKQLRLTGLVGAATSGDISIDDNEGHEIEDDDFDPAWFLGALVSFRF